MFAADLKGSTAVVRVKVEVKEEAVKEELVEATGRGVRRLKKEAVRGTASLVSEMISQTIPSIVHTPSEDSTTATATTTDRKRKLQPTTQSSVVTKRQTTTKTRTKASTGGRVSDMMTSVKREVVEDVKVVRGGVSGRSERYSARCDLLEVDVTSRP